MKTYTKASFSDAVSGREKENLCVSYEAACESIVLLKNDGTLPLKTKKLALYGAGASMTIKGGTGSGEVNERRAVSIYEGLTERGFEISTKKWIDDYEKHYAAAAARYETKRKENFSLSKLANMNELFGESFRAPDGRAVSAADVKASGTDSCIYVISRQAGEGKDRRVEKGDWLLTDAERRDIAFCAAAYEHFVLVINCGGPVDVGFLEEIDGINAVVYICQLGTEGGHAFADVISGAVPPSGKLADTWAKKYGDIPFADEYSYINGELEEEDYREGIFVGYRYFDSFGVEPAFPFGYGLGYTDFDISCLGVKTEGALVSLELEVKNVGAFSGREVAQLYLSAPAGALGREHQSLAAFGKTGGLAPGESEKMSLRFSLCRMAAWRSGDACFVLEAGDYVLRLGNSSRNTVPAAVLRLEREVVVSRHRNICPLQKDFQELSVPEKSPETLPEGLPVINLQPDAFETVSYSYEPARLREEPEVEKFLNSLSAADMAEIVVGTGMFGGRNVFDLPGSVGNTTSKFWEKGLANATLCDGPAGLRINKHSVMDKRGGIKAVELSMSVFEQLPGFIKGFLKGDPKKGTSLYQFTTAFPVAAALAQSWNTELLHRVGEAVYREMKEYGCTFWLAPAMNIHRNPLCGRNFEYFSEDPMLSGAMAAAICRGVQQEDGYYAAIKHFACNNQEANRNRVSSNLSERALREIYLRGFEDAVRNGGAKAVMTAYNRINGVYAPNSRDLCTDVLRREWGFDGVVMTDWFSTQKGRGDNVIAIASGNDLIMPGTPAAKREILQGLKEGRLSRVQLRRCCGNVVKAVMHSAIQKEYIK